MTEDEATVAVIDALEALAIPYMIVGSLLTPAEKKIRSPLDMRIMKYETQRNIC